MSTQIEMKQQAATPCIQAKLERNDSEALLNVVVRRAMLHNLVANVCRTLPGTATLVVNFDVGVVVTDPSRQVAQSQSMHPKLVLRQVVLGTNDEAFLELMFVVL